MAVELRLLTSTGALRLINLVVRYVDRRVTGKNDYTRQLNYSRDFSNFYYHLSRNHIERKNPVFNGFFYISTGLYLTGLDDGQRALLQSCGLQLLVQWKNNDRFHCFNATIPT